MASPLARRPNQPGPRVAMRQEWTKWHEVSIKLEGVPRGTTTLDIFRSMQAYGRIDSITIPQIRDPRSVNHAYVSFSPAPSNAFWTSGTIALIARGESRRVRIDLQSPRRPRMISSPLRPEVKYPERSLFRLKSLDFGIMSQERAMDIMKTIDDPVYYPTMTVNLRHKKIELQFSCSIDDPRREDLNIHRVAEPVGMREKPLYPPEFRADIQFRHMQEVFSVAVDQEHWCLLISQKHPPKFWKRRRDIDKSHQKEGTRWGDLDTWIRTTEISYADWAKKYPVTTYEPFQFLEIGKWTTYRLFFRKSDTSHWGPVKDALGDFNIQIIPTNTQTVTWKQGLPSTFRKWIDDPIVMDANDHLSLLHSTDKITLSYDVRYQLEAAISHGIFTEQSITLEFLRQLSEVDTQKDHDDKRASLVNRAKNILEYVTEADRPVYDPMALFKNRFALTHHTSIALPEHCTWVRKLIVTPSKVYLSSPCPETTNRVLRHYNNERDRFLRVQFTDERTDGKIHAHPDSDVSDSLFSRVYRALRQGIRIGDRHFHFLAFGNSQFREHGAYFFCPTATISCDDIRDWMGDFSHIDVVAKYASRLGQCFSTTRDPRGVGVGLLVKQIPDIEENGWCFTDGVGIISTWLAHEITRKLKLYQNGKVPSAFQFRHGGNKGILVNWPQANFNEIYIRPSQQKFTSRAKSLEIIRASRFSVATLNRQTISILSCLGVPDEVFIALTKNQLFDYSTAMTDPQVAIKLLGQFVDENGMTTTIAQMVKDGFMQSEEPFTKALLQLWRAWSMKLLREKARIVVENGVFVFGCIDETRTLRGQRNVNEGNPTKDRSKLPQIFLQVSRPDQPDSCQVIKGLCVVGRNPSLHPGDLRVVEAVDVDVPALKTLRNVVVFPADGDRDVASMCSGGDLDGDDYFVFWDPALLPEEWNHPPMVHDAVIPKKADGKITINNISRFFVEYLKNDSLSTIALAHVVWSDKCAEGPKSSQCLELAKLHSNAVDYIKTGQSARMSPGLHPKLWPHFMERTPEKSYRSEKILGKLYDLVAKVDFAPDFECTFDSRILRRYTISDDLLKSARGVKTQYDIAMRRIMNQREIGTEFEVWSTFVMSKPRVGSDYKVQEELGLVMMGLRDRFTQACIGQAEAEDPETQEIDRAKLYPFIAAMYHVTWEEVQIVLQEWQETRVIGGRLVPKRSKDQTPFISFPWLFEADLGRIATSATAEATESESLPSVPNIVQATSIDEAMGCVAACVDGSLFHRGEEIFMTTLDVEPMTDEDPISSGSSSSDLATTEAVVDEVEKEEDVEMEVEVEVEDLQVTSGLERLGLDSGN